MHIAIWLLAASGADARLQVANTPSTEQECAQLTEEVQELFRAGQVTRTEIQHAEAFRSKRKCGEDATGKLSEEICPMVEENLTKLKERSELITEMFDKVN